ncbi:MAG: site-2 protease family protein [candidate division Zixibacteria bacterium]|nr:site-2 protease family protein [candidate division Zixibacteria bacterium]
MKNPELISRSIYYQLVDLFDISAIYYHDGRLILRARPHFGKSEAITLMHRRLKSSGFEATVREDNNELLIGIKEIPIRKVPILNIILFVATLTTMFFAPALLTFKLDFLRQPGAIAERIEFTIALMAILLFHEFGHYIVGRRRGVLMSLPYFIPAPNIVGTFGAVIKSRSPFTNRRDLIEVGAAGPIAGFVISLIALSIGLYHSHIVATGAESGMMLGDSLLIKFLSRIIIGPIPEGYDYLLSPAAFAGWVGLLVTMINLLPLGQLDGGHIAYGLMGRQQHHLSKFFIAVMAAMGFWWPGWWFFGVLVFLFGIKHPPTFNDALRPSRRAYLLGFLAITIFVISFIPAPFKFD